jgi:hypothetical protein|nr:MAG TPA: hypothetical protein [Caudoviricetes sp.]
MLKLDTFLKKNSASILTVAAAAGVVCTSLLTARAAIKASKVIEIKEEKSGEKLTLGETLSAVWTIYIPPVILGISTIGCIFGANIFNKRQQASLASAYALINSSYKEYKAKVKELYGEETHNRIIDTIATEKPKDICVRAYGLADAYTQEMDENSEPRLFYDEYSGRYFESTPEKVLLAEYHLNRNYTLRGFAKLNEFYEFLGLESTDYGETVGWNVAGEIYWIDFNHRKAIIGDDTDSFECYIIEMSYSPGENYID